MAARAPCVALEASRVSILDQSPGRPPPSPVDMLRRGTRLSGGGDNVRVLDSLFFVFPLPFLSFLIWLFSCSC